MSGVESIVGWMTSTMASMTQQGILADASDVPGMSTSEPWRALRNSRSEFRSDALGKPLNFEEVNKVEGMNNAATFANNFAQHRASAPLDIRNFPNQKGYG